MLVVKQTGETYQLGVWEDRQLTLWTEPFASIREPVWRTDDSAVFAGRKESTSELWAASAEKTERLDSHPAGDFEPSVASDGRIVFGTSRDGNAELYELRDGGPVRLTEDPTDDTRPAFSPDGGSLAWLSGRSGVNRIWLDPASPRPLTSDGDGAHAAFSWSPDGSTMAIVVSSENATRLDIVRVSDGTILGEVRPDGVISHPSWSADGRWLTYTVSGPQGSSVWTAHRSGRDQRRLGIQAKSVWLPRWID